MNVIDLRTTEERMAPLDFVLTPFEKSEAAVYRCQIERQRLDPNAIDQAEGPRPDREQWGAGDAEWLAARARHYVGAT